MEAYVLETIVRASYEEVYLKPPLVFSGEIFARDYVMDEIEVQKAQYKNEKFTVHDNGNELVFIVGDYERTWRITKCKIA